LSPDRGIRGNISLAEIAKKIFVLKKYSGRTY